MTAEVRGETAADGTVHGLKVLSAGAVKRGVAQLAATFQAQSGTPVTVSFDTAPNLARRLAEGEAADVIVLPPRQLDELVAKGIAAAAPRAYLGRSRIGLIVKRGGPLPDIRTVAAFTGAVGAADAIVYNSASSGLYIERLLERLELTAAVRSRIVQVASGAAVMAAVAGHAGRAVGFGQLSEIRVQQDKGVAIELAGPLPDEVQNATPYEATVCLRSGAREVAARLVAAYAAPEARTVFAATGIA